MNRKTGIHFSGSGFSGSRTCAAERPFLRQKEKCPQASSPSALNKEELTRSFGLLAPSEQGDLDSLDVAEHGGRGAISISVFERCHHIGVLLAIMQSAVLRERF